MNRRSTAIIVTIAIIAAVGLIINYGLSAMNTAANSKIENKIVSHLPNILGPAKSYHARMDSPFASIDLMRGNIPSVKISAKKLALKNGMIVDNLDVTLHDIKADVKNGRVKKVGRAEYVVSVSEAELKSYIKKKYSGSGADDLNISLLDNNVHIGTSIAVHGFKTKASADAGLGISNKTQVIVKLKKITASNIVVPNIIKEKLESKYNPIFDASTLGHGFELKSLDIKQGKLILYGTVDNVDMRKL